jgi:hypothetical protein|tara:strand:- start:211 stop:573 length:363 start_codon:yes stop_codon:yes gene_type:complete
MTFFSKPALNNSQINSGNLPLLYPVRVICPAGATTGISFPDQFLGRAISLKITNNDSANSCSYDYNLNGQPQNLAASNFATIDNTMVNYLTIIAGAAGTTLIEAQVIPATRNEVPIEVQV